MIVALLAVVAVVDGLSALVRARLRRGGGPLPSGAGGLARLAVLAAAGAGLVAASAARLDLPLRELLSAGPLRSLLAFLARTFPPDLDPAFLKRIAPAAVETVAVSVVGTALAAALGLVLAWVAARPASAVPDGRRRGPPGRAGGGGVGGARRHELPPHHAGAPLGAPPRPRGRPRPVRRRARPGPPHRRGARPPLRRGARGGPLRPGRRPRGGRRGPGRVVALRRPAAGLSPARRLHALPMGGERPRLGGAGCRRGGRARHAAAAVPRALPRPPDPHPRPRHHRPRHGGRPRVGRPAPSSHGRFFTLAGAPHAPSRRRRRRRAPPPRRPRPRERRRAPRLRDPRRVADRAAAEVRAARRVPPRRDRARGEVRAGHGLRRDGGGARGGQARPRLVRRLHLRPGAPADRDRGPPRPAGGGRPLPLEVHRGGGLEGEDPRRPEGRVLRLRRA